jgi:hypothetical protein
MNATSESIGKQIDDIKNKTIDDILNMIDESFIVPFINLLVLSDISIDKFTKIIIKIKTCDLIDQKYVNYFDLAKHKSFKHIFAIFNVLAEKKKEFKHILNLKNESHYRVDNEIILQNFTTPGIYLLEHLFHYANETELLVLWKLIKHHQIPYDEHCNLLLVLINNYMFNEKQEKNYMFIIEQIIEQFPIALNMKPMPILNYIISHMGKIFYIYPEKEFKTTKYELSQSYISLLNLLVKTNKNIINYYDCHYVTPLVYAAMGNHVGLCKYLIDLGADINYTSYYGKSVNVFLTALRASDEIQNLFFQKSIFDKINFSYQDNNINNYATIVMQNANLYEDNFKKALLESIPDEILYKKNIYKENILHVMLAPSFQKKDDILKYIYILANKKLCWYQTSLFNETPLTLIMQLPSHIQIIIIDKLFIPNFIKFTSENNQLKIKNYIVKHGRDKKILNTMIDSLKTKEDNTIKLLTNKFMTNNDIGLFTSHTSHLIIYIYNLFQKYSNLGKLTSSGTSIACSVPDCWRITNFNNDFMSFTNIYNYITLTWINKNIYYIPTNVFKEIKNNTDKIYFMTLSIIRINNVNHANIIIINPKYKYAFRFEPYGNVNWDDIDTFDDIFEKDLLSVLSNYKYYRAKDYLPDHIFQAVSGEGDPLFTKIGDPPGYCLAWCYWFLESYLINKEPQDEHDLHKLVTKLYDKINNSDNYRSLLDYIRIYGNYLKEKEMKTLTKIGLPFNRLHANTFTDHENINIFTMINKMMAK